MKKSEIKVSTHTGLNGGTHINCIQYTAESFSTKQEVKDILWPRACKGRTPVYFIENPGLDTLVRILESGHAVQRGGDYTSFVWLDYDNEDKSNVHISKVAQELRGYHNIAVVGSSSGSPYKFHIIQHLPYEIPIESLGAECNRLKGIVQKAIPELRTFDSRCDLPDQTLFGVPTTHRGRTVFEGSTRISRIAKKTENPMDLLCPDNSALYIPLNSTALARMRGVTILDENGYRFDMLVPSMVPKFKKISIGHRYDWCKNMALRLLLRCFHLTHNCNYPVQKHDYMRTFIYLVLNNVVNPDSFYQEDGKALESLAAASWDRWENKPFTTQVLNLQSYFSDAEMPKKQYTSSRHVYEVTQQLIGEWTSYGFIHGKTIRIPHRRYLEDIASIYNTSYLAIKKAATFYGYDLQWKDSKLDSLPVHPDGYLIVKKGVEHKNVCRYLKKHSIPYISLKGDEFDIASKSYQTYSEFKSKTSQTSQNSSEHSSKISHFCSTLLSPPPLLIVRHKSEKNGEIGSKRAKIKEVASFCKIEESKEKPSKMKPQNEAKNEATEGVEKVKPLNKSGCKRAREIAEKLAKDIPLSKSDRQFVRRHPQAFNTTKEHR